MPYTAGGVLDPTIPSGTFIAFEDLPFPNSDFNYFDETYVFTDVSAVAMRDSGCTLTLLSLGLMGIGVLRRRMRG